MFFIIPGRFPLIPMAFALCLGALPAGAKGITMRFLASPAADSIVRYQILRADAPGALATPIGEISGLSNSGGSNGSGADTLVYADSSAAKGKPYAYSVRALDWQGGMSDPSEATLVAYPILSLPDTLKPDRITGLTRYAIPVAADPLRGSERLSIALLDSSRFSITFDSILNTVAFKTRTGRPDSGWAVVRAQYYGKFADQDSVLIVAGTQAPVTLGPNGREGGNGSAARTNAYPPAQMPSLRLWNGRDAAGRLLPILR